jgi:hypothetical protein
MIQPSPEVERRMVQIIDCFSRTIRLTGERLAHILEHP